MNVIRRLLLLCLLVLAMLAGVAYWLIYTETGSAWALQYGARFLPGQLHIQSVHGRLADKIELRGISYQSSSVLVNSGTLQLTWQPLQLLKGHVHITQLLVSDTQVTVLKSTAKQTQSRFPALALQIEDAQLRNLTLHLPQQPPLIIKQLSTTITLKQQLALTLNTDIAAPLIGHVKLQAHSDTAPHNVADLNAFLTTLQFSIDARLNAGATKVAITGDLSDRWRVQYQITTPNIKQFYSAASGGITITGNVSGLHNAPVLQATVTPKQLMLENNSAIRFNGTLTARVAVSGTINQPQLTGAVDIQQNQLALDKLGLQLRNLSLHITLDNQQLRYQGSVYSGGGVLNVQGQTALDTANLATTLTLNGQHFLISNTPDIQLYLSPELTISYKDEAWRMEGTVDIPKANIDLGDTRRTVTLPTETIIIDRNGKTQQSTTPTMFARVNVNLGNDVRLSASGLTGRLRGSLTITDEPQYPTLASGQLTLVDASYNLQGQRLDASNSTLIYNNSPIENPSLNIRASKRIAFNDNSHIFPQKQQILVGIQALGTADNPRINLFSDPTGWSQTDILSLLILGQPASMASGSNIALLATAAQTLGGKNGGSINQLTQQLQQTFGLSDFGLQSGLTDTSSMINNNVSATASTSAQPEKTTSFLLGKYLSPRLYLSYSVGILNTVNTIRLRYTLSKHWFLQTQSNTLGSGVDVIYSIHSSE